MRSDPRLTLTVSLLAAITGQPALATSGCECPDNGPIILHGGNPLDVPTNARLLLRHPEVELTPQNITLAAVRSPHHVPTSTHALPFRLEPTTGRLREVWVVPIDPLTPGTEYQLIVTDLERGFTHATPTFSTRMDPKPDETPPVLDFLQVTEGEFPGACGAQYGMSLDTRPPPPPGKQPGDREPMLLEVVIEGGQPSPQTVWVSPEAWAIGEAIDFESCKNFDGADETTELTATVTAYDAAGNKSEPRSTGRFRMTYSPAVFGCSATADVRDGVPPWTAVVLLVLGFVRSRRPRR